MLDPLQDLWEEVAECRNTSVAKGDVDAIGIAIAKALSQVRKDLNLLASAANDIMKMANDALDVTNDGAGVSCSTYGSKVSAPSRQIIATGWEEFGLLGGREGCPPSVYDAVPLLSPSEVFCTSAR